MPNEYRVSDLRTYDLNVLRGGQATMNRVLETVPSCWMCKKEDGKSTREHVFPQWLLREMPKSMQTFEPTRFTSTGLMGSHRGPLSGRALVAGGVCGPCNHGWMSSLEVAVQPIFRGQQDVVSGQELQSLAQWFVKTSVIINVSQQYRLLWDADRRHRVATGIPPNVLVSLYRVPEPDLNWRQGSLPLGVTRPGTDPIAFGRLIERTHVCEVQVGELVGVVVALPWELYSADVRSPGIAIWPQAASASISLSALPSEPLAFSGDVLVEEGHSGFWR